MTQYIFEPAPTPSVAVRGRAERYAVSRIFCVGRNYAAHAREMGFDPDREPPFYFNKTPCDLVASGATVPYPPGTQNYHYEMELVIAIGKPVFRVSPEQALDAVWAYGCGLDMTRRDLQLAARDKGRPWDLGKDIEQGSVCSEVVPMEGRVIEGGEIALEVNGQVRQKSDVGKLIWNIREIIADLSLYYHLEPGDLIYTGTPEGVGAVVPGDELRGRVEGVGSVTLTIGPAEAS
jgi:fumarylpyruvate hydrolase